MNGLGARTLRHGLGAIQRAAGPPGASFCGGEELQELLMEGLEQGPAKPLTPERRAAIYEVLKEDSLYRDTMSAAE